MRRLSTAGIRFYQKHISPHFPAVCRFRPSCSHYALEAIERFGSIRGIWLGTLRILRCNPFSEGGWDPVPLKFDILGRHKIPQPDPLFSAEAIAKRLGIELLPRTAFRSGRPRSAADAREPQETSRTEEIQIV